jgi:hypothetical protein
MSFSKQWASADENKKYQIREQSGLRAKISKCNQMFWRDGSEWKAKVDDELHTRNTWCQIVALCLEVKYGILVEIQKEHPLTYTKLPDSKPILNEERFSDIVDNLTMSHIKNLSPVDWQVIYQTLSRAAYHKDPTQCVPAALTVLKKLDANAKDLIITAHMSSLSI